MTQQTETKEALALMVAEAVPSLRDWCPNSTPIGDARVCRIWCEKCSGFVWATGTLDRDRIEAAIRERGWNLDILCHATLDGDAVDVFSDDIEMEFHGGVSATECLFGTHAVLLAFARALGLVE